MIERSTVTLNALQQRIVAALQVDGRAPWKRIAEVIREPERTVARHGTLLLDDGVVIVASTNLTERQLLVTCDCPPGAGRIAAEALAQLPETTFSYVTAGVTDAIAEVSYHSDTNELITRRLPAVPGTTRLRSAPVLKYFKTIRGWRSGMLTDEEERALEAPEAPIAPSGGSPTRRARTTRRSRRSSPQTAERASRRSPDRCA